jgi:hypothetical protein
LQILDKLPIPVAKPTSRSGRGNGFDWAEGGYCASKKLKYLGFKLGLLITLHGIPDVYAVFSAPPHDVQMLNALLGAQYDLIGLSDKAQHPTDGGYANASSGLSPFSRRAFI